MVNPVGAMTQAVTTTIASGESLTDAVPLGGNVLIGVFMPTAWTSATLSVQASPDGVTWYNVYSQDGTEYEITAAPSTAIYMDQISMMPWRHIRLRSGNSGAAVAQGADRDLVLEVGRPAD